MFDDLRLPLGDWVEAGVDWITANLAILFDFIKTIITGIYDAIEFILIEPPELVLILVLAAIAFVVRGWKMAVGTVVGLSSAETSPVSPARAARPPRT